MLKTIFVGLMLFSPFVLSDPDDSALNLVPEMHGKMVQFITSFTLPSENTSAPLKIFTSDQGHGYCYMEYQDAQLIGQPGSITVSEKTKFSIHSTAKDTGDTWGALHPPSLQTAKEVATGMFSEQAQKNMIARYAAKAAKRNVTKLELRQLGGDNKATITCVPAKDDAVSAKKLLEEFYAQALHDPYTATGHTPVIQDGPEDAAR